MRNGWRDLISAYRGIFGVREGSGDGGRDPERYEGEKRVEMLLALKNFGTKKGELFGPETLSHKGFEAIGSKQFWH